METQQFAAPRAPYPGRPPDSYEARMEKYAVQTKNAAQTVAWIVSIFAVLTLVGVVIVASQVSKISSGQDTGSSACVSQGGTVAGC
jgi:hypothetical protein